METSTGGFERSKEGGVRPPPKLPDWVYAYTAWMKKRLEGRGITLEPSLSREQCFRVAGSRLG
jgi:hypothetical protein